MRRWLGLLASILACGPSAERVPYRLEAMRLPAPPEPPGCTAALATGERWLVFVEDDCLACKDWLRTLRGATPRLRDAGVTVEVVVIDRDGCLGAMRVAGGWAHVRKGDDRAEEDWVVTSFPVTYRVRDDTVLGRLEGRVSLDRLAGQGWLPLR